jgi:hypothetical protein
MHRSFLGSTRDDLKEAGQTLLQQWRAPLLWPGTAQQAPAEPEAPPQDAFTPEPPPMAYPTAPRGGMSTRAMIGIGAAVLVGFMLLRGGGQAAPAAAPTRRRRRKAPRYYYAAPRRAPARGRRRRSYSRRSYARRSYRR